jgi:hypothetical protein
LAGKLTRLHKGGKSGDMWKVVADMAKAKAREGSGGGSKTGGAVRPAKRPDLPVTRAPGGSSAQASAVGDARQEPKRREYRGTLFTGGDFRPIFDSERRA